MKDKLGKITIILALICMGACIVIVVMGTIAKACLYDEMNAENKELTFDRDKWEQTALDNRIEADNTAGELEKARENLAECSKKIEEQETTIVTQADEITALKDEIKLLEGIIEGYNTVPESDYTESDKKILAATMYAENYISGRYEMMLTGSVVINRKNSPLFPNTIKDVVFQIDGEYEQYAKRTKNIVERVLRGEETIPSECFDLAEILLKYGSIAPPNVLYQAHFNQGNVFWEWKGEQFCY